MFGYTHIAQNWAATINQFNHEYLNPYITWHRPCFFPQTLINAKGKAQKNYPCEGMLTPCEKLKSLPDAEQYLKPEISLKELDDYAKRVTDNEAAKAVQDTRQNLFGLIFRPDKTA